MSNQLLLIDGDMIVFRALIGTEVETDWGDDIWTLHANEAQGKAKMAKRLSSIRETLGGRLVICFSGAGNFRKLIDPSYKDNRKKVRKPLGYASAVQWIMSREAKEAFGYYHPMMVTGLEADDTMGIMATKPEHLGRSVIVSDDKDMQTIPTKLWRKSGDDTGDEDLDGRQVIEVSTEMADRFHLLQTLSGDTSDGYDGCPGMGMVSAAELLDKGLKFEAVERTIQRGARKGEVETRWEKTAAETPWETVVSCYTKAGLTENHAITQARLARILRWEDWDAKRKEPILWSPQ